MKRLLILTAALVASCSPSPEEVWSVAGGVASAVAPVDGPNTMMYGIEAERLLTVPSPNPVKTYRIAFTSTAEDRLGNQTQVPMFTADFDANDVGAAQFNNLDPWEVLDLASSVKIDSPQGGAVLQRSCAGALHPRFCGSIVT